MNQKKLGGLGKLSQFSGIKSPRTEETVSKEVEKTAIDLNYNSSNGEISVIENTIEEKYVTKKATSKKPKKSIKEKPVTINIKITKSQKEWLSDTASMVRDNNTEPVPPAQRVYPQHLIGVAISWLQASEIDWSQIKNEKELREQLNL